MNFRFIRKLNETHLRIKLGHHTQFSMRLILLALQNSLNCKIIQYFPLWRESHNSTFRSANENQEMQNPTFAKL